MTEIKTLEQCKDITNSSIVGFIDSIVDLKGFITFHRETQIFYEFVESDTTESFHNKWTSLTKKDYAQSWLKQELNSLLLFNTFLEFLEW